MFSALTSLHSVFPNIQMLRIRFFYFQLEQNYQITKDFLNYTFPAEYKEIKWQVLQTIPTPKEPPKMINKTKNESRPNICNENDCKYLANLREDELLMEFEKIKKGVIESLRLSNAYGHYISSNYSKFKNQDVI